MTKKVNGTGREAGVLQWRFSAKQKICKKADEAGFHTTIFIKGQNLQISVLITRCSGISEIRSQRLWKVVSLDNDGVQLRPAPRGAKATANGFTVDDNGQVVLMMLTPSCRGRDRLRTAAARAKASALFSG